MFKFELLKPHNKFNICILKDVEKKMNKAPQVQKLKEKR